MPHITHYLPELEGSEKDFIQNLLSEMSHDQAILFASAYRQCRKDPHTVLLTSIIGLAGFPGLQRFWLGQLGKGFLYLFTWGLLLVGSIYDLVKYKSLTLAYNESIADQIVGNLSSIAGNRREDLNATLFRNTEFVR